MAYRKDISTTRIKHTRTDYYWSGDPSVLTAKEPTYSYHNYPTAGRSQSPIVKGDGIKPTSYTGIRMFASGGEYYYNDNNFIVVKGKAFSGLYNSSLKAPWCDHLGVSAPQVSYPGDTYFDNALIAALNQAANINFNALTALAEARSTADTLSSLAQRVGRIALSIKKLDVKGIQRQLKQARSSIVGTGPGKLHPNQFNKMVRRKKAPKGLSRNNPSDLWLEYRYGVMPILYDAAAIARALDGQVARVMYTTVRGSRSYDINRSESSTYATYKKSGTMKCRYGITLQIDSAAWATASELGVSHPSTTAWEVVPFSFIVDWMIPIGSWLTSLTSIPGVSFSHGYRSVHIKCDATEDYNKRYAGRTETYTRSVKTEAYRRWPISRIPVPLPRLQMPIRGISDLDRVADIFAIVAQLKK